MEFLKCPYEKKSLWNIRGFCRIILGFGNLKDVDYDRSGSVSVDCLLLSITVTEVTDKPILSDHPLR